MGRACIRALRTPASGWWHVVRRGEPMAEKDNKGSMTVAEAGRKGGETVRNERGREFYETIGRKGGATVKAERGRAFYEEIGRKGGETVKAVIEEGKRAARDAAAAPSGNSGHEPSKG